MGGASTKNDRIKTALSGFSSEQRRLSYVFPFFGGGSLFFRSSLMPHFFFLLNKNWTRTMSTAAMIGSMI